MKPTREDTSPSERIHFLIDIGPGFGVACGRFGGLIRFLLVLCFEGNHASDSLERPNLTPTSVAIVAYLRGLATRQVLLQVWLVAFALVSGQLCFGSVASAQVSSRKSAISSGSQIIVHVSGPSGEPLDVPGIVELYKSDGTPRGSTTAQGIAPVIFANVAPGSYYVQVSAPGYLRTREDANLDIPMPVEVYVYMRTEGGRASSTAPAGPPLLAPKARDELQRGLDALRTNDLKEAQKRLDSAAKLAPGHPDVFYLLGVLYIRLNEPAQAQHALEKATQLDPKHARALAALGTVLSNEGEFAKAIPLLRRAVELNDRAWETQWTLATAEYQERQFDQARDHAQRALALSQDKAPEIQLLLAQALLALGERDKAIQELEAFLLRHGDHPRAAAVRRWLAQARGER
jgi:Tfp pilus assembly protein PilF